MPVIPYNAWCDEDIYMDEMARMHKLTPKLDIIKILRKQFELTKTNQQLTAEQQWLLTYLSGQIVALSMELTDDLAAVCLAYLKSLSKHDRRVIEYISKMSMGKGHKFYENTSNNPDYASKAIGLDITTCSQPQKENIRQKFTKIKQLRKDFWHWYNGYKHGQYATPIVITATNSQGKKIQEWGLYLVPRNFQRDIARGKVHTEDRFINTVGNVDLFVNLAEEAVQLWVETRNRQYPKVFNRTLP